ncbi:MAG: hypothetical protein KDA54_21100, partial [Phycisphaerales bacterium]|nr:hypothetical protein [Phycisphaerales bacterium]
FNVPDNGGVGCDAPSSQAIAGVAQLERLSLKHNCPTAPSFPRRRESRGKTNSIHVSTDARAVKSRRAKRYVWMKIAIGVFAPMYIEAKT